MEETIRNERYDGTNYKSNILWPVERSPLAKRHIAKFLPKKSELGLIFCSIHLSYLKQKTKDNYSILNRQNGSRMEKNISIVERVQWSTWIGNIDILTNLHHRLYMERGSDPTNSSIRSYYLRVLQQEKRKKVSTRQVYITSLVESSYIRSQKSR